MKIHLHILRARIEETYQEIEIEDSTQFDDISNAIKVKLPGVIADPNIAWVQTEIVPVAAQAVRKPEEDEDRSKPCTCPICRKIGPNEAMFVDLNGKRACDDA